MLLQGASALRASSSMHYHHGLLQAYGRYPRPGTKSRPTPKRPDIELACNEPTAEPDVPVRQSVTMAAKTTRASEGKAIPTDIAISLSKDNGHNAMDIDEEDAKHAVPQTNGESTVNSKLHRMNQYFEGNKPEGFAAGQLMATQSLAAKRAKNPPATVGRDSFVDCDSEEELSENINPVFRFPAFNQGMSLAVANKNSKVRTNAFTHA